MLHATATCCSAWTQTSQSLMGNVTRDINIFASMMVFCCENINNMSLVLWFCPDLDQLSIKPIKPGRYFLLSVYYIIFYVYRRIEIIFSQFLVNIILTLFLDVVSIWLNLSFLSVAMVTLVSSSCVLCVLKDKPPLSPQRLSLHTVTH